MLQCMELPHLRSFVVVAEEMHLSRAATRLHLAQPTLSRQIAALERTLGVPLFSRAHRRLRLTSAGAVLLPEAREILRRVDSAVRDARRAARGEVGRLRLGFVQSATYQALPHLVQRFRAACPDVRLEASPMTTLRQIAALRSGAIDAGLLRPRQPVDRPHGVRTRVLTRDRWLVALPSAHPLAARDRVPLAALADEPFVSYAKEEGSTGHDFIIDHCRRSGFRPRVVQEVPDAQSIVALVSAGLGISLMLGPPPPVDPALVVYRPLRDHLPAWELALAWSDAHPSAVLDRLLEVTTTTDHHPDPADPDPDPDSDSADLGAVQSGSPESGTEYS